jgi:hypothetical protein
MKIQGLKKDSSDASGYLSASTFKIPKQSCAIWLQAETYENNNHL